MMTKRAMYHASVQAFGHGPGGDDVIHHALRQRSRNLVQLHKLSHVVEHLVILGRCRCHLLDDGRHVTKDRRVQQGCVGFDVVDKAREKQQERLLASLYHTSAVYYMGSVVETTLCVTKTAGVHITKVEPLEAFGTRLIA